MILVTIALGFSLLYLFLQIRYLIYWNKTPSLSIPKNIAAELGVTIVIVAHNEEKSIGRCLKALVEQKYPAELIDIIVIDDHSSDGTLDVMSKMNNPLIRVLSLKDFPNYIQSKAFKKSGITLAVDKAKFETIVVTDADCYMAEDWLLTLLYSFQQQRAVFQTAPVLLREGNSMLLKMQEMEQLILMLITGSGIRSRQHILANGANLIFQKSAFTAVKGFEGNYQYASGDDMFLAEKMSTAYPDQVTFVKSLQASVYTEGKKTWSSLFKQRLRWAGKNKGLKNKSITRIWLFVGAYHVVMILSLVAALLSIIPPLPFIILLCVKWTADYILLATSAGFFRKTSLLRYFVPLQVMYAYYVLLLGIQMLIGKKGDWQRA